MKLRGPSITAFLQQAEANLALLSAQLQDGPRSKRRAARSQSPEFQVKELDELEVREQLTVQARTLLGFERRLKALEARPGAATDVQWHEDLSRAAESMGKELGRELQRRLDLAEQRLKEHCELHFALSAQAPPQAQASQASQGSEAAKPTSTPEPKALTPTATPTEVAMSPTSVGFQDPVALRSSPRHNRSPKVGTPRKLVFMPDASASASLFRRQSSTLSLPSSAPPEGIPLPQQVEDPYLSQPPGEAKDLELPLESQVKPAEDPWDDILGGLREDLRSNDTVPLAEGQNCTDSAEKLKGGAQIDAATPENAKEEAQDPKPQPHLSSGSRKSSVAAEEVETADAQKVQEAAAEPSLLAAHFTNTADLVPKQHQDPSSSQASSKESSIVEQIEVESVEEPFVPEAAAEPSLLITRDATTADPVPQQQQALSSTQTDLQHTVSHASSGESSILVENIESVAHEQSVPEAASLLAQHVTNTAAHVPQQQHGLSIAQADLQRTVSHGSSGESSIAVEIESVAHERFVPEAATEPFSRVAHVTNTADPVPQQQHGLSSAQADLQRTLSHGSSGESSIAVEEIESVAHERFVPEAAAEPSLRVAHVTKTAAPVPQQQQGLFSAKAHLQRTVSHGSSGDSSIAVEEIESVAHEQSVPEVVAEPSLRAAHVTHTAAPLPQQQQGLSSTKADLQRTVSHGSSGESSIAVEEIESVAHERFVPEAAAEPSLRVAHVTKTAAPVPQQQQGLSSAPADLQRTVSEGSSGESSIAVEEIESVAHERFVPEAATEPFSRVAHVTHTADPVPQQQHGLSSAQADLQRTLSHGSSGESSIAVEEIEPIGRYSSQAPRASDQFASSTSKLPTFHVQQVPDVKKIPAASKDDDDYSYESYEEEESEEEASGESHDVVVALAQDSSSESGFRTTRPLDTE
ncbi:unnamed protein product [Effrenium voratum]|uniref:Uncharacterized protein n=2 Tax=Effrenium voratum TaxID=2562239 RepID=A0AA36MUG7_9DINO|nr:unnamed protein product [Effrenium voratum]